MKASVLYAVLFAFTQGVGIAAPPKAKAGQDFIIVIDASRSMNLFDGRRGRKFKLYQTLVTQFLQKIPEANHRVYLHFFNDGTKEQSREYIFKAGRNDKAEAIAFVERYREFIAGNRTHLWSSFHKALRFGEANGYFKPAKNGRAATYPAVYLFTDGGDDQVKDGWTWKKDLKQLNKPAILVVHSWLQKLIDNPRWKRWHNLHQFK